MSQAGRGEENLPDWAHNACVMLVVAVFAAPLAWAGIRALVLKVLPPMSGPGFGMWMFGNTALEGRAAIAGAWSLLWLAATFLALGLGWTRWADQRRWLRWLPWPLCAMSLALSFWAVSLGHA